MRRQTTVILASIGILFFAHILPAQPQNTTAAAVNRWTRTADLTAARSQTCAAVLKDGRLLVAGGMGLSGPVATVDIYGSDGSFTAGPPMSQARAQAACSTLGDGTVLVSGGDGGTGALNTAEIFDPVAGKWSAAGNLSSAREGHTAVVTVGGNVWIAGGTNGGAVVGTIELYSLGKFQTVGALKTPRTGFAMAASGERTLYIAGGTDGTNVLNTVESYDTLFGVVAIVGTMSQGRRDFGAAALLDGRLLLMGGVDTNGNLLANSEVFDPVAGTSSPGPALLTPRAHHSALTLPGNGSILIYGGEGATTTLNTSEIYTPWSGAIAAATPLTGARRDQANVMLRPGSLMVAGGRDDNGPLASSELYQFAYLHTDKNDYAPGTPVHITGGGWQPGENVLVTITAFPVDQHHVEFTGAATADGAGNITVNGFAVDKSHLGMKFLMTAVGSQSQAEDTFTDAFTPSISVTLVSYTPGTNTLDLSITAAPEGGGTQTPTGTVVLYTGTTASSSGSTISSAYWGGAETGYTCDVNKQCTLYCAPSTPCTSATIVTTPQTSSVTVKVNPPSGSTTFGAAYAPDATAPPNGSAGYYGFVSPQNSTLYTFNNSASTTVSVSGPATSNFGSAVTYIATVTPTPSGTATGRVDFCDNATGTCTGAGDPGFIGFATMTAGSGNVASFTTSALTVGTHKISAYYEGDTNNSPSSSTNFVTTVVSKAATSTTLMGSAPDPLTGVQIGRTVTLTATASTPGVSTVALTGSFTFTLAGNYTVTTCGTSSGPGQYTVNSPGTTSSAAVTCTFTVQGPPGTINASVVYNGDANTASSTGSPNPLTITVVKVLTQTTLTGSATPDALTAVQINRTVTLTATVGLQSANTTGISTIPLGGTFTFTLSGNYTLVSCGNPGTPLTVPSTGTAVTATGTCSFTVQGPAGTYNYSVIYNGDTNTAASTGTPNPLPVTVVPDVTTTTLAVTQDADSTVPCGTNVGVFALDRRAPAAKNVNQACANTQAGRVITLTASTTPSLNTTTVTGTWTFTLPHGTYTSPSCGVQSGDTFQVTVNSASAGATSGACSFIVQGPAQTDTYTVAYSGDGNNQPSPTSPATALASIPVILATTTTTITSISDLDPTTATQIGRVITINASTQTNPNVFDLPAGSFTFNFPQGAVMVNNSSSAGCGNLMTGATSATVTTITNSLNSAAGGFGTARASCTFIITAPAGTNSYTVTYNGDTNTASSTTATPSTITTIKANTYTVLTITSPDGSTNPTQLGHQITLTATTYTDQNVFVAPTPGDQAIVPPTGTAANSTCGTPTLVVDTNFTGGGQSFLRSRAVGGGTYGNTNPPNGQLTQTCTYIVIAPKTGPGGTPGSTSFAGVVNYAGDGSTKSGALLNPPTLSTIASPTCVAAQGGTCFTGTDNVGTSYIYGQAVTIPLAIDTLTTTTVPGTTPGLPSAGIYPTGTVTFNGIQNIVNTPVLTLPTSGSSYQYPAMVTLVSEPTAASNNATTIVTPNVLTAGSYNISAVYSGDTSYQGSSEPISFTINRAQTMVGVQGLSVPAGVANLRVVVANSSAAGVGTPTGIVQVTNATGGSVVASGSLSPSSSCAPLTVSQCSVATVTVPSGNYAGIYCGNLSGGVCTGDTNFLPGGASSSTAATGVTATSSLVITASPNPAPVGATILLTATVNGSGGAGAPTGSVQFSDNGNVIGVAPLAAGIATLSISLSPGSHNIGGVYSGDATYPQATYNFGVTVTKPQPNATFSSNLTTSVFGQQVVLTVRFTSPIQGGALPSGTVQFLNNGQNLGNPVQIVNGVATLTISNLPIGADSIGVVYNGDSTYASLTKNVGSVLVTQAQTTTALTTAVSGAQMTLTATVSVAAPGAGTPTGTVQFMDTTTQQVLGTAPVNTSGVATLTVALTGDPVVATYSGDANFLGSTSPNSAAATISLSNSASYVQAFAPGTIVVAFGKGLTTQAISGTLPLVTSLGGITVTVTDSAGVPRQAPLFYVSPTQISFMIPPQTATGTATVTVATSTGSLTATITVTSSASALYSANASGSGPLAAQVAVYTPGGQVTYVNTAALSGATYINAPISLTPTSNTFYLILYGTGFDNAKAVTVTINGQTYNPSYAGPQGTFPGLDQINVLLPSSMAGAGQVNVSVTVDGQVSNVGTIAFAGGGTN